MDPCDKDAACTNTDGSFFCLCNTGFVGNGTHCEGILLVLYNSYCMSWLHIIQCCMKLLPLRYIICVKAHRLLH